MLRVGKRCLLITDIVISSPGDENMLEEVGTGSNYITIQELDGEDGFPAVSYTLNRPFRPWSKI